MAAVLRCARRRAGAALVAVVLAACGPSTSGRPPGADGPAAGAVDPARSSVTVDRATGARADGSDAVTVAIIVRDAAGAALAGVTVHVATSTAGSAVTQPEAPTDAAGAAGARLTATAPGATTITVTAGSGADAVTLAEQPTVTFDPVTTPPVATKLAFLVAPGATVAGAAISPAVTVAVEDASGQAVTGATDAITLALAGGTAGAALGGARTAAAVAGVARFGDLTVDRPGAGYTLVATATGLAGATSAAFTVTPNGAVRLAFTVPPGAALAGAALAPAVTVEIQDATGARVTTAQGAVTVALGANPGAATLGGAKTMIAAAGVATFADLTVDRAASGYTLIATATGLTGATSAAFDVAPGPPAKLEFLVEPAGFSADGAGSAQVGVADALGNLVTTATTSLSLGVASGPAGALLVGGDPTPAAGGLVTFTFGLDRAGDYTLAATGAGLTPALSASFTVTAGAAVALAFAIPPAPASADAATLAPVEVAVVDGHGNPTPSTAAITVALGTSPAGATLGGTTALAATAGAATFTTLALHTAGDYTLSATAAGFAAVTSPTFAIAPGAPAALAFATPPGDGTAGVALGPAVAVALRDAHGNLAVTASAGVSVSLSQNPGGDPLGTVTAAPAGGVATFAALILRRAAAGYVLRATAGALPSVDSAPFAITPGATARFALTGLPAAATAGASLSVTVSAQDAFGNLTPAYAGTVRFTSSDGQAALPADTPFGPGDGGTRSFAGGVVLKSAGARTVAATDAAAPAVTGAAGVTVAAAAAAALAFTTPPAASPVAAPLAPAPVVQAQDAFGNPVAAYGGPVAVTLDAAPAGAHLTGTTSALASGGVATFVDLVLDVAAAGYRLRAHSGALLDALSPTFPAYGAPAPGDLIITEIMHAPAGGALAKQWLELRNVSPRLLALAGLNVTDTAPASPPTFTVATLALVAPGGTFLLGAAADPYGGGQVVPDSVWPATFALGASAGTLVLALGATTLDTLAYDGSWPGAAGHSMTLAGPVAAAAGVDQRRWYWCDATTAIPGGADYGTPGAANDDCGVSPAAPPVSWCAIQWPQAIPDTGPPVVLPLSASLSQVVSGRLSQPGVTTVNQDGNDRYPYLTADLGWGASADPSTWSWIAAGYSPDAEYHGGATPTPSFQANDDEIQATLAIATPGSYRYGFRVGLVDPTTGVPTYAWCGRTGVVDLANATQWSDFATAQVVAPCTPSQVVISQVYGGGGASSGSATYSCDFVELHNRGVSPVALDGWSLQYGAAANTTWTSFGKLDFPAGTTLPAGGYYLVQGACGSVGAALPTPDAVTAIAMAAGAGKVALVAATALLTACPTAADAVDLVGYGATTVCSWGAATPTLSTTTAAGRAAAGCVDTGDNGADFTVATPAPRTSATTPSHCGCGG